MLVNITLVNETTYLGDIIFKPDIADEWRGLLLERVFGIGMNLNERFLVLLWFF